MAMQCQSHGCCCVNVWWCVFLVIPKKRQNPSSPKNSVLPLLCGQRIVVRCFFVSKCSLYRGKDLVLAAGGGKARRAGRYIYYSINGLKFLVVGNIVSRFHLDVVFFHHVCFWFVAFTPHAIDYIVKREI